MNISKIPAQILALDARRDLWQELAKEVHGRLGCEVRPFICGDGNILPRSDYDHIDLPAKDMPAWGYGREGYKNHHYNAILCHKKMIRIAQANRWNKFLMLEDDAYITPRFEDIYSKLEINNYDLLYLGWWIGDEKDKWNTNIEKQYAQTKEIKINKVERLGGLHGVIINETIYDIILDLPENNPIDCQLNNIHNLINSYYITPKIIHVKSVYSFCEGSIIERLVL